MTYPTLAKLTAASQALTDFIEQEQDSLNQALLAMAEHNDKAAAQTREAGHGPFADYAAVFEESAASWRAKAARLEQLLDAARPYDESELR